MHSKTYLTFFCVLCSLVLPVGCETLHTDHLPKGVAKGYVEFYRKADVTGGKIPGLYEGYQLPIYQLQDGKKIYMGNLRVRSAGSTGIRRRIACTPGQHTFFMGKAASSTIQVEVYQDKITFVKYTIIPGEVTRQSIGNLSTVTYHFNIFLDAEEAVPVTK